MTATATEGVAIRDTPRLRRCRMRKSLDDPCPNPALSEDPKDIAICVRHAAQVMQLIADQTRKARS
ncbi:hypothetical protein ACQP2T_28155 [Nonomuraea sp. CA-143628]|uniref:hypothetical protein n=1 Tax=Nonomuraea sp. CA-143628 TaxID=3239997 RepID=UPI003D948848